MMLRLTESAPIVTCSRVIDRGDHAVVVDLAPGRTGRGLDDHLAGDREGFWARASQTSTMLARQQSCQLVPDRLVPEFLDAHGERPGPEHPTGGDLDRESGSDRDDGLGGTSQRGLPPVPMAVCPESLNELRKAMGRPA